MKKLTLKLWSILALLIFTVACDDDDNSLNTEPITFEESESDWVRITLLREGGIDLMQANTGQIVSSVNESLPEAARLYTSNSGQYLAVIDRSGNQLRFFDSGVINHADHGHQEATRWLDKTVDAPVPTHYASTGGHMVVFNDGDGSITHINEAQLEIPSYEPNVITFENTVAHHGAGFRLKNGKFAITFKNTNEPGGLPQMVKFINADGTVIDDNGEVEVTGIHGDATNGVFGVFGSTDGVILVDDQDNISLIQNTGDLNSESGNWIGTLKGHDNTNLFFGRARELGIYVIDPVSQDLTSLYEGSDVVSDMLSFNGEYYLVHTEDNTIRVYDAENGNAITERVVEMENIPAMETTNGRSSRSEIEILRKMEEPSPVLICSDQFLYVLAPNREEIKVLQIRDLSHVHTIQLNSAVDSMVKNGFTEI